MSVTRYDIESTSMIAGLSPWEAVVRLDGEYVLAADYLALQQVAQQAAVALENPLLGRQALEALEKVGVTP